ncbi:MAG: hypothetical protein NVSMB6_08410 [Burkholderiaceae bacterium]
MRAYNARLAGLLPGARLIEGDLSGGIGICLALVAARKFGWRLDDTLKARA